MRRSADRRAGSESLTAPDAATSRALARRFARRPCSPAGSCGAWRPVRRAHPWLLHRAPTVFVGALSPSRGSGSLRPSIPGGAMSPARWRSPAHHPTCTLFRHVSPPTLSSVSRRADLALVLPAQAPLGRHTTRSRARDGLLRYTPWVGTSRVAPWPRLQPRMLRAASYPRSGPALYRRTTCRCLLPPGDRVRTAMVR
jgi:hypothetical protein